MNANWVGPQILKELTQMIDIDPSNLVHIENKKIIRYAVNKNYTNIKYVNNPNLILWAIDNYPDAINYTKISFNKIVEFIWQKQHDYFTGKSKIQLITSILDNYSGLTFENLVYCLLRFKIDISILTIYDKIIYMINNKKNAYTLLGLFPEYVKHINPDIVNEYYTPFTKTNKTNDDLIIEYIYLDSNERKLFAQTPHEQCIIQMDYT